MPIAFFPFKYYSVLPDSTLTTKIRQETWNIDQLFPVFRQTKSDFRELAKRMPDAAEAAKLQHSIVMLAAEIRTGIKDLKLINFFDSTIIYLYYRLLHHVYGLCKKEEEKLASEERRAIEGSQKLEDIAKARKEAGRKIKDCERKIRGLNFGEGELTAAGTKMLNWLKKLRWKAEKQAQEEFSFSKFTLRSMENINRKIKVEAIKVKKMIPKKALLMRRINKGKINPEDVVHLARFVAEAIDRISKDASYSSKLISKFESEFRNLKLIVESLKKSVNKNKKISEEDKKKMFEPWDSAVNYVENEVHKDLMEIFRNIFGEYKYIGTRPISKAA